MKKKTLILALILLAFIAVPLLYFKPSITGFAAASSVNNYTQDIS